MVITAITLENFKGIKGPYRIKLRPLTMLFGANSAGKSSVVQGLHYAREIFMRHNTDPDRTMLGGSMDLGGFSSLVYKHDQSLPIRISFDLDLSLDTLPNYYDEDDTKLWEWEQNDLKEAVGRVQSATVSITVEFIEKGRRHPLAGSAAVTEYEVHANGEQLAKLELIAGDEQVRLTLNPLNIICWETPEERATFAEYFKAKLANEEVEEPEDVNMGAFLRNLWVDAIAPDHEASVDHDSFRLFASNIVRGMDAPFPQWGQILPLSKSFEPLDKMEDDPYSLPSYIISSCLTSLITGPGEMVRNDLEKMCYLGPIREVPERNYVEVKSPDPSRWANGLAAWDALYRQGEELIKKTNHWLASDERLDSGYRIELEESRRINEHSRLMLAILAGRSLDSFQEDLDEIRAQAPQKQLYLQEEAKNIKVLPQDIGVGISQVIPVVVSSLLADESILAIEQPELHIHPKLQVALGDLLIQESTTKSNCFIIETHSEHLMLRVMKRIRQTSSNELPPEAPALDPGQVAIYHIRSAEEGTIFKEIVIDKDGDFLTRWPGGFFAERSEELFS